MLINSLSLADNNIIYTCPMHPHYQSEEMGNCPICGMDLVAIENYDDADYHANTDQLEGATNHHNQSDSIERKPTDKKILYWVAPMDPNYRSDKPGKSPMGMDLVPVYAEDSDIEEKTGSTDSATGVIIKIPAVTIQNMGVRTAAATKHNFGGEIRSYGSVEANERLQKKIYSRVDGWISQLAVSAVGDEVKAGDLLYRIHSPDLLLAQHDFLSLERSGRNISLSKLFVHYEVDKKFVDNLRKTKIVKEDVPYYAPYSGTISQLNIRTGSYVSTSKPLMVLEDYSSVWVNAHLSEQDLQFINKQSRAKVIFPNLGNIAYAAHIDYIYPTIDMETRTGKVRLVLDNPNSIFRPGSYVDVVFETDIQERLAVPTEALLKSADGDYVVVALGKGRFQPRKVDAGISGGGYTEILSGVNEGDKVVVSGQFLIDSESSLRSAFRKMSKQESNKSNIKGDTAANTAGGAHAGH